MHRLLKKYDLDLLWCGGKGGKKLKLIRNSYLIKAYLWGVSVNKTFSETFLPYFQCFLQV